MPESPNDIVLNLYKANEKIDYENLAKVGVVYPKLVINEIQSKLNVSSISKVYVKVLVTNFLRDSKQRYATEIFDAETPFSSVV